MEPVEDPVGHLLAGPVEETDVSGVPLKIDRDLAVAAVSPHRDLGRYDVGAYAAVVGGREGRVTVRDTSSTGVGPTFPIVAIVLARRAGKLTNSPLGVGKAVSA